MWFLLCACTSGLTWTPSLYCKCWLSVCAQLGQHHLVFWLPGPVALQPFLVIVWPSHPGPL